MPPLEHSPHTINLAKIKCNCHCLLKFNDPDNFPQPFLICFNRFTPKGPFTPAEYQPPYILPYLLSSTPPQSASASTA